MPILILILTTFSLCCAAQAQNALKSLDGFDSANTWQAVGRIDLGKRGFCTGALIRSDLVLTAAHCLFDNTGKRVDDREIQFLAGLRHGRAEAYRGVRQSFIPSDYIYSGRENLESVESDLAVMRLSQPIKHPKIQPFATASNLKAGQQLTVVSYAKDRSDAPSLQKTCHIIEHQEPLYVTSCDIDVGSSGAPVFVEIDGKPFIFSIISAKAELDDKKVSLAIGLSQKLPELLEGIAQGDVESEVNDSRPIVRPLTGKNSSRRENSGVLFIKP